MKTTKSRIIFFAIAITYNLLLGLYLKDFLVLSQTLTAFYLLSVLPAFFLLTETRTRAMRTIVHIVLMLDILTNLVYFICCRRLLPVMTMLLLVTELMYYITGTVRTGKDGLVTKIYVLVIAGLILLMGITAYNFVCKPETPYLANGGAPLWDTQTEELADEICADSDTDAEKVQAIYSWMITNLEYDYDYQTLLQYFNVRRTLSTRKGVCYDFANLFAALCRSQSIPCYVVDGIPYNRATENHTWNRVYYDGCWWDVDVTNDITSTANGKSLYGFRELTSAHTSDKDYYITKIY
ncbi:MAG: transglutaminase domain-containing protein [Oscillospiraceae bacterium]|nr:transglutaminase domain-containing protein [Oscillospiraceae bacterium]